MRDNELPGLWNQFCRCRSAEIKSRLVSRYLYLVRFVVSRFGLQVPGRMLGLEREDMVQYGVLGLVHAIDRFSPDCQVKFETFAVPRIRGAILDELRKVDWVPRSVRAGRRKRALAADRIAQETGREPVEEEMAERLEMTLEEYRQSVDEETCPGAPAGTGKIAPGEEGDAVDRLAEPSPDPCEQLKGAERKDLLVKAISSLPEKERSVIVLYYYEGLRFLEIGMLLGVSESRVSQIHAAVLEKLRARLGDPS